MEHKTITFEQLPELLSNILDKIEGLCLEVERLKPPSNRNEHTLISIEEVCQITGKAKATIYAMVCRREIPCCKVGKKLYFYEDEIMEWIEKGRKLTSYQITEKAMKRR